MSELLYEKEKGTSSPNRGKSFPSSVFENSCQVETGTDYLAGTNFRIAQNNAQNNHVAY